MYVTVVPFTGPPHTISCSTQTTLAQLRQLVAERTGVPSSRQSLLFGDDNLATCAPTATLASLGVGDGARLGLYVIARSGPCELVFPTVDAVPTPSCSSRVVDGGGQRRLVFDAREVKKRAADNLRTLGRVRELRHCLAQRRAHAGHRERTPEPSASTARKRRPSRMSAPEDTSAKESSAGECDDVSLDHDEWHTPRCRVDDSPTHVAPCECTAVRRLM